MIKRFVNLIKSGKLSKKLSENNIVMFYFIAGFVIIIASFVIYSQMLIKSMREESKRAPALFADYIYNTKSYLDEAQTNYEKIATNLQTINEHYEQANQNSFVLAKIFERWIRSLGDVHGEEKFNEYFASKFTQDLKFPIILTDADSVPLTWKNIDVDEGDFRRLPRSQQETLLNMLKQMEVIDVEIDGIIINYVYYASIKNSLTEPPIPPKRFDEFLKTIPQSIIVTDKLHHPVMWNNIPEVPDSVVYEDLTVHQKAMLIGAMLEMSPIPVSLNDENVTNIYLKEISAIRGFNLFSIIQTIIIVLFVFIGLLAYKYIKHAENDSIWVGLAKETAHQLGTPITSLVGWIEYLKINEEFQTEENSELIGYMERDVSHLRKIASRFGKIGSKMDLEPLEVEKLIDDTVNYIRLRLPHLGSKIELTYTSNLDDVMIKTEKDLFGWVLENLLKNCVDAIGENGGSISVESFVRNNSVVILVQDTGKGIEKHMFKKIFKAGVTTKKRGWGLGLSLVRRIIVDYHKGKIKILKSVVGKGTTFEISFPVYDPTEYRKYF